MTHGHELKEWNVGGRVCVGWKGINGGKKYPFLGIYPKGIKTHINTKSHKRMFITFLFIIAKKYKE